MSDYIEIKGGVPLEGSIVASGAKNAALPLLIASLLTSEPCEFRNVPNLEDVSLTIGLLEHFGAEVDFFNGVAKVQVPSLIATEASYSLVKALRASFWVLAPILARGRAARVALPGGDIIGARPVDMHLSALTKMGGDIRVKHGVVFATAVNGLKAAKIDFRFPSVGATHQILMAAALTPGLTTITGAAQEPEVVSVANFIAELGAKVEGAGTSTISIEGRDNLSGASVDLIGDRIETATYLLAGAASGGNVRVDKVNPKDLGDFLKVLDDMGLEVNTGSDFVSVKNTGKIKPVHVSTGPFPALATDIQALLMAALCVADGESSIEENVFEGRYGHVSELCRMGANIKVDDRVATICGVDGLTGAPVEALDIRAGAALVIAALAAKEGTTSIYEPQHLRRGYALLEEKIRALGGSIGHKFSDPEDYMFIGC